MFWLCAAVSFNGLHTLFVSLTCFFSYKDVDRDLTCCCDANLRWRQVECCLVFDETFGHYCILDAGNKGYLKFLK